jgi:hypothetical protein
VSLIEHYAQQDAVAEIENGAVTREELAPGAFAALRSVMAIAENLELMSRSAPAPGDTFSAGEKRSQQVVAIGLRQAIEEALR